MNRFALLTDEQISPVVAAQVRSKRPDIDIVALHEWNGGVCLGSRDDSLLDAAFGEMRVLVTYDQATIPDLLVAWGEHNKPHAGVVFVDETTIRSDDFGGIVRAIIALHDNTADWLWMDRIVFLQRAAP